MAVKRKPKFLLKFIIFIFILLLLAGASLLTWNYMLSPVDKTSKADIEVVIPSGSGVDKIASILEEKHLIRNKYVFKIYMKLNSKGTLKASTYNLKKSMSVEEIANILEKGNNYNPDSIKITFKEGSRITDYILLIAQETNHTPEEVRDVMVDKEYIESLVNKYWFLTEEILNPDIYYPLEGYLFPDTYYFVNKDVEIEKIIETMLDQMEDNLKDYKNKIGQNIHKYVTMASIVELEGKREEDRKMIVGVFNNRLAKGMNLGSDVTTYYALQYPMTSDLTQAQFATDNPYNTRADNMAGKLPVGPICNPSIMSIDASINPTANDYYYFVADKNAKIYYTKTLQEHNAKVEELKKNGDWIW